MSEGFYVLFLSLSLSLPINLSHVEFSCVASVRVLFRVGFLPWLAPGFELHITIFMFHRAWLFVRDLSIRNALVID